MKKIKLLGLIVMLMVMMFPGCKKTTEDPAGLRGVAVVAAISKVNPVNFNSKDLVNSFVQFDLTVPEGFQGVTAIIQGSYKNDFKRITLATVTSFPATVKLVSGDVIQKLGISPATVKNGDNFVIEVVTTANGVTTRSNAIRNVSVACAFEPALAVGSYHSVSAKWQTDGNITLTASPTDPFTIYVKDLETIDGNVEDKGPLVMTINPLTFAVTVTKTVLVSVAAWGETNVTYAGSGVYKSCDGTYSMNFDITTTESNYGTFAFTFTRN